MSAAVVLVTGGAGFLGRAVVRRCLDRGWRVRVLGRTPPEGELAGQVEFHRGDIGERSVVDTAVKGCDYVFHVAAKAGVWGPWEDYVRVNVDGTRNVIDACEAHGVKALVHTSTPSVVFNGEAFRGVDESLPYGGNWLCAYAETKAVAEQLALKAASEEFKVCALRPHLIWGPGDPHIFPRLLARARAGRLRIVGDGRNKVDVTHVDTAADAHLGALDALLAGRANGKAYFISQGEPVNLWDFINRLLVGAGEKPVTRRLGVRPAYWLGAALEGAWTLFRLGGEPPMTRFVAVELAKDHWYDVSAARRDLGLRPAVETWAELDRLAATLRKK
ncbi:MAG: NAD-dependent epimerase/dehydratase family protein [Verrucomicrobiota bacterium]